MRTCKKCSTSKTESEFRGNRLRCKECERQYQRDWYKKAPDLLRERKRLSMAKMRLTPQGRRKQNESSRKAYLNGGNLKQKARLVKIKASNFFKWRSLRSYSGITFSEHQLKALWDGQHGKCALTSRSLDGESQLDHIIPLSRGGVTEITNMRWVVHEANICKRHLLDDEFTTLCQDVINTLKSVIEHDERK